jgi:polyhydroxybutyrate depolymerase
VARVLRKVAWLAAVAVLVLGGTAFGLLHLGGGHGPQAKASVRVPVRTTTKTVNVNGVERGYEVFAPARALPASAPVIVMLSGYGATVDEEVTRDQLVPYVSADEAELVYPVAVDRSWNAIGCCGYASGMNVDDLAFLKSLATAVDPGKQRPLYLVGFSNGARLAYRVACTDPDEFDAYAMVKGLPTTGCVVRKPVTLIQLASVDDPEIPYKPGDKGLEPLPVTTEMAALRGSDDCRWTTDVTHAKDMTLTTWSGCTGEARLASAVWQAGAHVFPRPPDNKQGAAAVIWSFLTNTALAPLP